MTNLPRLDELSIEEWWDVLRLVRPHLTWDEHEESWAEFVEWKARKDLQ